MSHIIEKTLGKSAGGERHTLSLERNQKLSTEFLCQMTRLAVASHQWSKSERAITIKYTPVGIALMAG